MRYQIKTTHAFGTEAIDGLKIDVASLTEAIEQLALYTQARFPNSRQKVNNFRWDTWVPGQDLQCILCQDSMPLELICFESRPMDAALNAVIHQVDAYKCLIPSGGGLFYRSLNCLVALCQHVEVMITGPSRLPSGYKLGDEMPTVFNGIRDLVNTLPDAIIADSQGSDSEESKEQWAAIKLQISVFCRAAQKRLEEVHGIKLMHCWPNK